MEVELDIAWVPPSQKMASLHWKAWPFFLFQELGRSGFFVGGQTMGLGQTTILLNLEVLLSNSLLWRAASLNLEKDGKDNFQKYWVLLHHAMKADINKHLFIHWIATIQGSHVKPPHIHIKVFAWTVSTCLTWQMETLLQHRKNWC